jgi:hypothetical protein
MSCDGGHLGFPIGIKNSKLVKDIPMIIHLQFGFSQFIGFREEHILDIFSSPGPKVQVNYCHHLASVVCKLFTFQASSPKPLGRLEQNLAEECAIYSEQITSNNLYSNFETFL